MERRLELLIRPEEDGRPVSEVLRRRAGLTRGQIRTIKFIPGGLTVAGEQVRSNTCLRAGQLLEVLLEALPPEGEENISSGGVLLPQPGPLDILYEDEDVIGVVKPAGMVVHPSPGHYADSLANRLAYYLYGTKSGCIRAVGRLDRDTSGVMLFAKNQVAAAKLDQQRKRGQLQKEYLALVQGCPGMMSGIVREPIGKEPGSLMKMQVDPDGKIAVTHFAVLQQWEDYSLVRLHLETGRTHQIRVHMAWLGCPLLGDPLYGTAGYLERTALHAGKLQFLQPFTGKEIMIETALPEDMRCLTNSLTIPAGDANAGESV